MAERLLVYFRDVLVGELRQLPSGVSFRYATSWRERPDAFAVSLSLPLDDAEHTTTFFANLLPEANVRTLLARRLGLSEDNDFALLRAVGGECAGALTILPEDVEVRSTTADYEPLSKRRLTELARTYEALPRVDAEGHTRLSLAGAQDKLPVYVDGDRFFLPIGNSPSTHILKFPNRDFKHLPANEVLVMELARRVGVRTVSTRWYPAGEEGLCVVERFDRVRRPDGTVERLHQEDMCQALGVPASRKYEEEGGPSFTDVVELVREHSVDPLGDTLSLFEWLAYGAVVGNADGHAKNLALLHAHGIRLAPFYDLVCTRAYDRIDRRLAMSIGGERDPDRLRRPHLHACARALDVKAGLLVDVFVRTGEAVLRELEAAIEASGTGSSPAAERCRPIVRKQARRVLRELR